MFGGNSNWRGPVWFPINIMLIRALLNLYLYYGDNFTVECPTGSGQQLNLYDVAEELADRLTGTFLRDADGRRPGARRPADRCRTTRTGATCSCSTSTSMATTGPGSAPATRPAGPGLVGAAAAAVPGRHHRADAPRTRIAAVASRSRGHGPAARRRPPDDGHGQRHDRWPAQPVIYELNTAIWLTGLSRAAGRRRPWPTCPTPTGTRRPRHVDAVWLMGVWERSPAGLALANANAGLLASFREALPDLEPPTS